MASLPITDAAASASAASVSQSQASASSSLSSVAAAAAYSGQSSASQATSGKDTNLPATFVSPSTGASPVSASSSSSQSVDSQSGSPSTPPSPGSENPDASSLSTSTAPSTPTPVNSIQPLSSTTSTSQVSPTSSPNTSNTGLIAAAAVLGGVLAIAIIALIFLLIRNRRLSNRRREQSPAMELKDSPDRTITNLKTTIIGLEKSLEDRDSTIRHAQAAALKNGHQAGDSSLGDAQIRDRFTALSQSINDWIVTYFKSERLGNVQSPDISEALRKAVPGYQRLIEEPRTKYLVVRALVADIIVDAFANGDFVGSAAYSELKRGIDFDSNGFEFNEWNAVTVALLDKSPQCQNARASAVQNIVSQIDQLTSKFADLEYSERRLNHLREPIDAAAKLAVALAKQPALYTLAIDQPGSPFNPDTMEDALQDASGHTLRGRRIQGTAFPAVKKTTVPQGSGVVQTIFLRKAQVIV